VSHLPGKKRTADLNRRMEKSAPPEQEESKADTDASSLSSTEKVVRPAQTRMKKSERLPVMDTSEAIPVQSDFITDFPIADEDELKSVASKRYASGQINTEDLGDAVSADEIVEGEWSERSEEGTGFIIPVIWSLLGLSILVAAIAIVTRKKPDVVTLAPTEKMQTEELLYQEGLLDREERAEVEAIYDELIDRLRSFLLADNIEDKAKFIRQPDRVIPLMKKYYEKHEIKVITDDRFSVFRPTTINNRAFWVTALDNESGGDVTPVLIEQTEDNRLLIDWETFVTYQEHDWDQILTDRPEGEYQMRVRASPSDYFLYEFSDRSEWGCLYLTGRGGEKDAYGFFKLDQPFWPELKFYLSHLKNNRELSLVVTLTFPQNTKAEKSTIITDIKSFNWVFVEPIEEEESVK